MKPTLDKGLFFASCPSHIMDVSTLPGLSNHDVTNCNKGRHETFNSWLSNCKPKEEFYFTKTLNKIILGLG